MIVVCVTLIGVRIYRGPSHEPYCVSCWKSKAPSYFHHLYHQPAMFCMITTGNSIHHNIFKQPFLLWTIQHLQYFVKFLSKHSLFFHIHASTTYKTCRQNLHDGIFGPTVDISTIYFFFRERYHQSITDMFLVQ